MSVCFAESPFGRIVPRNTALTTVTSRGGLENTVNLTSAQYERERRYRLSRALIQSFRDKGLLTEAEYRQAMERLLESCDPIWGHYPDATKSLSYHELP